MENEKLLPSGGSHHPFEISANIKNCNLVILHNDIAAEANSTVWVADPHSHLHCEIIVLLSGEETVYFENSNVSLTAGDICIIPKGMVHRCIPAGSIQKRSSLLIFLEKKGARLSVQEQLLCHILQDLINGSTSPLILRNNVALYREFNDMLRALSTQLLSSIIFKFQLSLWIFRCLDAVYRLFPESPAPGKLDISFYDLDTRNTRAVLLQSFVHDHYKKRHTIEELAAFLHLGVRQTRREVIKHYGVGYNAVINSFRIQKAKQLLKNGERIDRIAEEVGFDSVSGFRKAFHRLTGMNPSRFTDDNGQE